MDDGTAFTLVFWNVVDDFHDWSLINFFFLLILYSLSRVRICCFNPIFLLIVFQSLKDFFFLVRTLQRDALFPHKTCLFALFEGGSWHVGGIDVLDGLMGGYSSNIFLLIFK
jgi:hypothetical protein